jgi:hypothetical protein
MDYRIQTQRVGDDWQAWHSWSAVPRPPIGKGKSEIEAVTDLFTKLIMGEKAPEAQPYK